MVILSFYAIQDRKLKLSSFVAIHLQNLMMLCNFMYYMEGLAQLKQAADSCFHAIVPLKIQL